MRARRLILRGAMVVAVAALAFWAGHRERVAAGAGAGKTAVVKGKAARTTSAQDSTLSPDAAQSQLAFQRISADPKITPAELLNFPLKQRDFAFGIWVGLHPGEEMQAVAVAQTVGNPADRLAIEYEIVNSWRQHDAQGALAWAASLAPSESSVLAGTVHEVLLNDPVSLSMEYAPKIADASLRSASINEVAVHLADSTPGFGTNDPAGAIAWLNQVATGANYDDTVVGIFVGAVNEDPAQAQALLGEVQGVGAREKSITSLATAWARDDPAMALQWLQVLPAEDQSASRGAESAVAVTWADYDPQAALAYLQSLPDQTPFLANATTIAQSLAVWDPAQALAWVSTLPQGDAQNKAMTDVLMTAAQTDFSSAWNYAANTQALTPADQSALLGKLVTNLGQRDLAKATEYLLQLPPGPAQADAVNSLAGYWAIHNPQQYQTWSNSLTSDEQSAATAAATQAVQTAKLPSSIRHALLAQLSSSATVRSP